MVEAHHVQVCTKGCKGVFIGLGWGRGVEGLEVTLAGVVSRICSEEGINAAHHVWV